MAETVVCDFKSSGDKRLQLEKERFHSMPKKVFLLQEIIPNYRVPVFEKIGKIDGVDLTLFFSQPNKAMRQENLKNAENFCHLKSFEIPIWEYRRLVYQFDFLKHIFVKKPEVVICGQAGRLDMLLCLLVCKSLGIRFLWFLGGVPHIEKQKIEDYANLGRLNSLFGKHNPRRYLVNKADGIICYSDHAKEYYTSSGFPKKRIFVAPNSPDTDALWQHHRQLLLNPLFVELLRKRFCPDDEKIIFLLGRLNKERKADILIRAVSKLQKKHPGVCLVIVGDGDQMPRLKMLVRSLKVQKVFFEGAIYDDAVLSEYFMNCDIFVTPGVASMAIKMAMLFGKPVVSVDYGLEVHAIENGKNGFIFPDGDYDMLADKITMLLEDDQTALAVGAAARNTIETRINVQKNDRRLSPCDL